MKKTEILSYIHEWNFDGVNPFNTMKETSNNILMFRSTNNIFGWGSMGREECKELFYAEFIWAIQHFIRDIKKRKSTKQ